MVPLLGRFIFVLLIIPGIYCCPEIVKALCQCGEVTGGVVLDCSGQDASRVVQILKQYQNGLGVIQALNLQKSQLNHLPSNFFAGLYIKRLDLTHNNLTTIDDHAFEKMEPVLQELLLNHNNLHKLPSVSLAPLKSVMRIDFSNNSLTELEASDALPRLPKLFDINLGSNKINSVHKVVFENIKDVVQSINLGHNELKAVPSSAIRGFKQLQALHLHHNNISALDNLAFLNIPVLNLLNLANNNITEVRPQAFLNVPRLRHLYLTNNFIKDIKAHQFAAFESMEMLDMTKNMIEVIPKYAFSNLPQLKQLYLGSNLINRIEEDAFANSSIAILILANNNITELRENGLTGLPSVQQISFKENQMTTIHPNAFFGIPSLMMLDLSHNNLSSLPDSIFEAQLNLLLVDLSWNQLMRTPYKSFNSKAGTVLLQENPLVCTEQVHMIKDHQGIYIKNSEDLICGGEPAPPHVMVTTPASKENPFLQDGTQAQTFETDDTVVSSSLLGNTKIEMKPPRRLSGPSAPVEPILTPISSLSNPDLPARPTNSLNMIPHRLMMNGVRKIPYAKPNPESGLIHPQHNTLPELQEVQELPEKAPSTKIPYPFTENPHRIYPFPVPFLKRGPNLSKSSSVPLGTRRIEDPSQAPEVSANVADEVPEPEDNLPRLPASIILAPPPRPKTSESDEEKKRFEQVALETSLSPLEGDTGSSTVDLDASPTSWARLTSPSTIIIICLAVVALVVVAVFIGLCATKLHNMRRINNSTYDASTARTNAYVAQQAEQLNVMYGTAGRSKYHDDATTPQPWVYKPGQAYTYYRS